MATKLFVGSLSYNTTDATLEEFFAQIGKVLSAKVIIDRDTNRSKGFGFVEMESDDDAKAAIAQLDGKDLDGRRLIVNEARPQENRERRSFGGGDNRGGGGYGGNRDRTSSF
jgi:RNA recognition motif-containing protein